MSFVPIVKVAPLTVVLAFVAKVTVVELVKDKTVVAKVTPAEPAPLTKTFFPTSAATKAAVALVSVAVPVVIAASPNVLVSPLAPYAATLNA